MDILAGIFELIASYKLGDKRKLGFILAILASSIWTYVAFKQEVYGLLIVCIPGIIINIRNYIKWSRDESRDKR